MAKKDERQKTDAPVAEETVGGAQGVPEPEAVTAEVIEEPAEGEESEDGEVEAEAEAAELTNDELVAKAQAEVEEWKDKHLRLQAEWNTYRRRMSDQREQEKALAAAKLVESLIPVIDDFERTIAYAQQNGEAGLLGGVEAVHTKFVDVLTKDGVVVIDPAGEAFDALEAQAVGTVEDPSVPDETVAQVYQKGYKIGNKVLRPAMVTITTGGPKRPKEETEE